MVSLSQRTQQSKYLLPTAKEKSIGVNSVSNGTANEGQPVEDYWRFIGVFDK